MTLHRSLKRFSTRRLAGLVGWGFCGLIPLLASAAIAAPVPITLLHTNDLHSHFRPQRDKQGLGGIARIKTLVDQIKSSTANTIFVDGGDWSEGQIYYHLGAGTETLKMMEALGYDVAVVGNHDWLNGPDTLLDSYVASRAQNLKLIAANVKVDAYRRAGEFSQIVPPYTVKTVGGVKVAFIGVVTHEFVYDRFFNPVTITAPQSLVRDLAKDLKATRKAQVVVVISHNSISRNEEILRVAPDVDLVIGAHDHVKLTAPVIVTRTGAKPGWVVETGSWGRFVGRVDLEYDASTGVSLKKYGLLQIDRTITEDATIKTQIETLESTLERKYGTIFHDHVADAEVEIGREGFENKMGNLLTDAYMHAVRADFAFDQVNFINEGLHEGKLRTVDFYNSLPLVYDPVVDHSWTLKTFPMTGRTLKWILNLLFAVKKNLPGAGYLDGSVLSTSGLQFTYSPVFQSRGLQTLDIPGAVNSALTFDDPAVSFVVRDVLIQGKALDLGATYTVAAGGGIIQAIEFINTLIPNAVSLTGLRDTGLEDWRALLNYGTIITPITAVKAPIGDRINTAVADLGALPEDTVATVTDQDASTVALRAQTQVKNFGNVSSKGGSARLLLNRNGTNEAIDPDWLEVGAAQIIPALAPGQAQLVEWQIKVPVARKGNYALTVQLNDDSTSINHTNDQSTRWFTAP